MLPIKRILAPTDFSEPSYGGVHAADELARHFGAEVLLIHVVSPFHIVPPAGGLMDSGNIYTTVMEQIFDSAQTGIEEVRQGKINQHLSSRSLVIQGSPAEEIARVAEEEKADVIVLSTHGRTGWRRFILGSVAERVVRLAQCPVITIPAPDRE